MSLRERLALWSRPALYLGNNPITLAGAVVTTSAAMLLVGFWARELLGGGPVHPYAGILLYLVLPGFFLGGLFLIPLGAWWRLRKLRAGHSLPHVYPQVDLRSPILLRAIVLVCVATVLNVLLMGTATYRGVEYMDTAQFCGQTCHTVMEPEFSAFVDSAHSRVGCVQCHIGPGAPWFVRSKISGARQILAVTFNTHSRPIPSPVRELRPARETCAQCHWPQKFVGDKFLVRTKYSSDETNTPLTTVLVLKIGGRTWQGLTGIHGRHLDDRERISYISTDGRRQIIPVVRYLDDDGKTVEFVSDEVKLTPEQLAKGEVRTMDCMDCHNRPTHAFQMPERAVDRAMGAGEINPQLPFIKKESVELLRGEYPDHSTSDAKISSALIEFYRSKYPQVFQTKRAQIESAVVHLQGIYRRNVFPSMKVTWGTYPNNLGHDDFPGCFRCHDGNHKSKDGRVISQDCTTCHNMLAMEEANPKILTDLGLK